MVNSSEAQIPVLEGFAFGLSVGWSQVPSMTLSCQGEPSGHDQDFLVNWWVTSTHLGPRGVRHRLASLLFSPLYLLAFSYTSVQHGYSLTVSKSYIQPVKNTSWLSCTDTSEVWNLGRAVTPAHLLPEDQVLTWTQCSTPAFPLKASSRGWGTVPKTHWHGEQDFCSQADCLPNPDPVPPSGALVLSTEAVSRPPGWLSAAGTIGIHQSLSVVNAQAGCGRRPAAMIQSSWRGEKLVGFVTLLATPPPPHSKWNAFHL